MVGHGGLQQRYDTTLRGTPGVSVVIAREAADGTVSDTQLFSTKPVDGKPIKVTIDEKTQIAADAALATQKQPSSLVAIKVSDGSGTVGFVLKSLRGSPETVSTVKNTGARTVSLRLTPGQWYFFTPGGTRDPFIVTG